MDKMTELEQLKEELEKVKDAIFMMSMSDNYCYTTGRIYPLMHKEKDIKAKIEELEKKDEN